MSLQIASCDDQYKKFPQLDRNEVLKLKEWHEKQPHLPDVTGWSRHFYTILRRKKISEQLLRKFKIPEMKFQKKRFRNLKIKQMISDRNISISWCFFFKSIFFCSFENEFIVLYCLFTKWYLGYLCLQTKKNRKLYQKISNLFFN